MYVSKSEGANFWLQVLTDLHNRGLKDILIARIDNLKGFSEAIQCVRTKTEVQSCIVHQIRNYFKNVTSKDQKEFMRDLELVNRSYIKDLAEIELEDLATNWKHKYPIVVKSYQNN